MIETGWSIYHLYSHATFILKIVKETLLLFRRMEKANTMEVAETNKFWLKRKKANKLSFSFSYEDKWIALKKIHKVWDSSPYLSLTKYALPAYHISKKKKLLNSLKQKQMILTSYSYRWFFYISNNTMIINQGCKVFFF
jgi:vesicle coat complex subunit